MTEYQKEYQESQKDEGAGGAGSQQVGSPINLHNTGTRLSETFPIIIRGNVYSLTLQEMTDLHGQVWTQLQNR